MPYRVRDLSCAFLMTVFLFPLIAIISAVILFFYGRPVFYREGRIGLYGRLFTLYKFRTLHSVRGRAKAADNLEGRILKNGTPENCRGVFFKFLRKHSLDELPQLWNVLAGDMSIVGPRPMPANELLYRFGSDASRVISVRPGLTGLWQINGRNDLSFEERRRLDLRYVEKRSALFDCRIILKTFSAVLSGKGAY